MPLHRQPIWPALLAAVLIAGCNDPSSEDKTTTSSLSAAVTTSPSTTTNARVDVPDLFVVGDWGAGSEAQDAVARAMEREAADTDVAAILTTGDNLYSDDADSLLEPFDWVTGAGIPFWIVWGNHDVETEERVETMDDTFEEPPRWGVYEWGMVDVIVLDSTQIDSDQQSEFLDDALATNDDPTIVVFHHPVFSCGAHGNTERIQARWIDEFDDDVFLVLSGHEHNYQHFEDGDVTYVVTGGGGATLTDIAECSPGSPEMVAGASIHHFLVLEQDDDVTVTALDVDGGVIDQFTLGLP